MTENMRKNNSIKVLHIITGLGVGGAESILVDLLKNMDGRRIDQSVLCLGSPVRRIELDDFDGVNIEYLEEDKPLGTAGALMLLPTNVSKHPLLVMNGDILTKVNFRRLVEYHSEQKADLTVCVRSYEFQVPYGVVEITNNRVRNLHEKPVQSFFVNAGIYIVDNNVVSEYNGNTAIDMPDFINHHVDAGRNISAFPIHEYWLDVGVMEHYKKAQSDIENS